MVNENSGIFDQIGSGIKRLTRFGADVVKDTAEGATTRGATVESATSILASIGRSSWVTGLASGLAAIFHMFGMEDMANKILTRVASWGGRVSQTDKNMNAFSRSMADGQYNADTIDPNDPDNVEISPGVGPNGSDPMTNVEVAGAAGAALTTTALAGGVLYGGTKVLKKGGGALANKFTGNAGNTNTGTPGIRTQQQADMDALNDDGRSSKPKMSKKKAILALGTAAVTGISAFFAGKASADEGTATLDTAADGPATTPQSNAAILDAGADKAERPQTATEWALEQGEAFFESENVQNIARITPYTRVPMGLADMASNVINGDVENLGEDAAKLGASTASAWAGAALGATIGSVVPVVGTAIGGFVGGTAGFLIGDQAMDSYFNSKADPEVSTPVPQQRAQLSLVPQ